MLLSEVTCPHCWEKSPSDQARWLSQHADLTGDARIGPDAQTRFLGTRFTSDGNARDLKHKVCRRLACPACHLEVPRALYSSPALFFSMIGSSGAGKSYYLAAMVNKLREVLFNRFKLPFRDADQELNQALLSYETAIFSNDSPDKPVKLTELVVKTQAQGDLYQTVLDGHHATHYVRPYLFLLGPREDRPGPGPSHLVCLYDNAGEHYLPGRDTSDAPVTHHLKESQGLFVVLDPTRVARFAAAHGAKAAGGEEFQERSILDAFDRVRGLLALKDHQEVPRPLYVVLTKSDSWGPAMGIAPLESPFTPRPDATDRLDRDQIAAESRKLEELVKRHCPNLRRGFAQFSKATYLAVSALGPSVEDVPGLGPCVRPGRVDPKGVVVPMLLALADAAPEVFS